MGQDVVFSATACACVHYPSAATEFYPFARKSRLFRLAILIGHDLLYLIVELSAFSRLLNVQVDLMGIIQSLNERELDGLVVILVLEFLPRQCGQQFLLLLARQIRT